MITVIGHIVVKEFLQTFRDARMRAMIIIAPIFQLIIFGFAISTEIVRTRTVVIDRDNTSYSRNLLSTIFSTHEFVFLKKVQDLKEAKRLIEKGEARVILYIPYGFERTIKRGSAPELMVLIDGTESNSAITINGYINNIVNRWWQKIAKKEIFDFKVSAIVLPNVESEPRLWYNPELKSSHFMIPGITGFILVITTMIMTAMGITREYETGTMEQIFVTPVKPVELIIGKTLPFVLVGLLDVTLIIVFARIIFALPVRGSLALFFLLTFGFLLSMIGIGIFVSTISKTQEQAMLTAFFIILPFILLSGFFFSIRSMPLPAQLFTYINPLRYFIESARGIFLKGTGISAHWKNVLILYIFGFAILLLSTKRFRKQLS